MEKRLGINGKKEKMPNQKVRKQAINAHYSENTGLILGRRNRQLRFGKNQKSEVKMFSNYLGSSITPQTRNTYEELQSEYFIERFKADLERRRNKILAQTDKTQEEIDLQISKMDADQLSESDLLEMSKRFARSQSNKETKHFKAWLKGDDFFVYKGNKFPVMTQAFIDKTKEIIEIEKVKEEINDTDTGRSS